VVGGSVFFQSQQALLEVDPEGKAGQRTSRTDHPVAGDDEADWIGRIGASDSTGGTTELGGELPIRARLASRNVLEGLPYPLLKSRSRRGERQVEGGAPTE